MGAYRNFAVTVLITVIFGVVLLAALSDFWTSFLKEFSIAKAGLWLVLATVPFCLFVVFDISVADAALRRSRRWGFICALVAIATMVGIVIWPLGTNATPIVILTSAVLATIGWILQGHTSRKLQADRHEMNQRLQRKQYTLRLIQDYRSDSVIEKHRNNVFSEYPAGINMEGKDMPRLYRDYNDKKKYSEAAIEASPPPTLASILVILNFFEQLASGVKEKDIDDGIVTDTISGPMEHYFQKVFPCIKVSWRRDHEHCEHFRWLMNKWNWERGQGDRNGDVKYFPVSPDDWDSEFWIEDGGREKWGDASNGPWGRTAVADDLLERAGANEPDVTEDHGEGDARSD